MNNNKIKNILATLERGAPEGAMASMVCNSVREDKGDLKPLHNAAPAGYEQTIDTLTFIKTDIIKQKFYEVNPADYVPVKVGEGAFTNESLYYTNFQLGDDFSSGIIGQGNGSRKAKTEVGYDSVRLTNYFWAKELEYSLIEVQQAAQNMGSAISLISQKEESQKRNWDLGIQKTAFLGQEDIDGVDGLLTLDNQGVAIDIATLTKAISAMTSTEINAFVKSVVAQYWINSGKTAMPDTFCIPTTDFLGLGTFVAENQPTISKYDFLLKAFQFATRNPSFKIESVQYGDKNDNSLAVNRYALYKNDSRVIEMNIPIDYTSTSFASGNSFDFASVAYGQFSGVIAKRPAEVLYFDNTVTLG